MQQVTLIDKVLTKERAYFMPVSKKSELSYIIQRFEKITVKQFQ